MSRAWIPSRGWEPLTEEQLTSLAIARENFAETCTWAHYIGRMSRSDSRSNEHTTESEGEGITTNTKRADHNTIRIGMINTKSNCARSMHVTCAEVATQ